MNDGFADRPLKPLGHPHVIGSLTGFEPATTRPQPGALPTELQTPCSCGSRIRTCVRFLAGPAYETGELGHYSIPRFCRSRRVRTSDLRFWRPTFYQLNYAPIVEVEGLEPTKPNGGRFTVCSRCRWRTPQYICGTSWSRTTFSGFSVLRIHQVCQSSIRGG